MAEANNTTVLVSGASGYVATHCIKVLIREGYKVRGTVRSLKNEAKNKPILALGTESNSIELVEANLSDEECWKSAVDGCEYVLHVASPFPNEAPKHEDEIVKPAVDGVLNVLKACRDVGGVKRVVLTSSMAAVNSGTEVRDTPWTEEDWTDTSTLSMPADAYYKSKTDAERAGWDFVKDLPEDNKFELAVINPGYVLGPILCGGYATSTELPKRLLEREMPGIARLGFATVDVRDVAEAHFKAMVLEEAAGKRHLMAPGSFWLKDMAVILDTEFRPQGYNVPTMELPDFMVKFIGFFDKSTGLITKLLGKKPVLDASRMKEVLKIPGRDFKNTMIDMAYSMIENRQVKKTAKYTGPKYSE